MKNLKNKSMLVKTIEVVNVGVDILSNAMIIAWPITIVSLMIYFN
jgi:hypothetical protein